MRMVCQFSCGAASAIATKITLAKYPAEQVIIVNAYIKEEHEDNRRFLADCERWFQHPIQVIRDEKYGASTDEVWRRKRFIKGIRGAPCSLALKREPLGLVSLPDDIAVIGFTLEEQGRFDDLQDHFPHIRWDAPLIREGLRHNDCLTMCKDAGIEIPLMYRLGYNNANCVGCPKGGQNYWQAIRRDFPERFAAVMAIQEDIGPNAAFLKFNTGPKAGQRMPLRELPEGNGNMGAEPGFSCSFACDQIEREIGIR